MFLRPSLSALRYHFTVVSMYIGAKSDNGGEKSGKPASCCSFEKPQSPQYFPMIGKYEIDEIFDICDVD